MGCDVHLYAETYNEESNQWEICVPKKYKGYGNYFEESPWTFELDDWEAVKEGKEAGWLFIWDENTDWLALAKNNEKSYKESEYEKEPAVYVNLMDWDVGRDYGLFHALAGVRSSWGGHKTISEPRGNPANCSAEYQHVSDRMDGDGHSHSYLTADEILDNLNKEDFGAMYDHAVELKEKANGKGNNARFVFFFDN